MSTAETIDAARAACTAAREASTNALASGGYYSSAVTQTMTDARRA